MHCLVTACLRDSIGDVLSVVSKIKLHLLQASFRRHLSYNIIFCCTCACIIIIAGIQIGKQLILFFNSAPSEMSYMFSLNTLFWCIAIGFPALYCKIWKVIKSGVQAFNIFLELFSIFGQSLVTVFSVELC